MNQYQIRRVMLLSRKVCGGKRCLYYGSSITQGGRITFYLIEFHTLAVADRVYEPGSPICSNV